jgi:hypothetical protein
MNTRLEETLLRVVDATRFGAVAVSDDRRLAFLTLERPPGRERLHPKLWAAEPDAEPRALAPEPAPRTGPLSWAPGGAVLAYVGAGALVDGV